MPVNSPRGERAIHHDTSALLQAVGEDFLFHAPVEHVEAVLHDVHAANGFAFADLVEREIRYADGAHLALVHEAVQGVHGLVERRVDIGPVDEQHVQVIGSQVLQALLD